MFLLSLHIHQAQSECAGFLHELRPGKDRHFTAVRRNPDAPGVKETRPSLSEIEQVGSFEEEVTLLRVGDIKSGEVDYLAVAFDLGEIGFEREVEYCVCCNAVLHIETVPKSIFRIFTLFFFNLILYDGSFTGRFLLG